MNQTFYDKQGIVKQHDEFNKKEFSFSGNLKHVGVYVFLKIIVWKKGFFFKNLHSNIISDNI